MSTSHPQLSLAEGLYVLNPRCSGSDVLAYTLAELIMLNVIRLQKTYMRSHPKDPAKVAVRLVEKGSNFDDFSPRPHQFALVRHLSENKKLPLHTLAREIVPDKKPGNFKKKVLIPHLYNEGLARPVIGLPALSRKGKALKKEVKSQLKSFRSLFRKRTDAPEFKTLIQNIGLLVLLDKKTSFDALPQLESAWEQGVPNASSKSDTMYSWYGVSSVAKAATFKHLDVYMDSFEKCYMGRQSNLMGESIGFAGKGIRTYRM